MSLLTFMTNLATFMTGPFGISLATVAVAVAAIGAVMGRHGWVRLFEVLGACAILFSAAWVIQTFVSA